MVPTLNDEQRELRRLWWDEKLSSAINLPSAGNKNDLLQDPRVIERYGRLMWIKLLALIDPLFRRSLLNLESTETGPVRSFLTRRSVPVTAITNLDFYEAVLICHILENGARRNGPNVTSAIILATNEWGWRPSSGANEVLWQISNKTDPDGIQGWFSYRTMRVVAEPLLSISSLGRESALAFMAFAWPTAPWYYMHIFTAAQRMILKKSKIAYNDSVQTMMAARIDYGVGEKAIKSWPIRAIYATQAGLGNPSWFGYKEGDSKVVKVATMSYQPKNWNGKELYEYIVFPSKFDMLHLDPVGIITGQGDGACVPKDVIQGLLETAYANEWSYPMIGKGGSRSDLLQDSGSKLALMTVSASLRYHSDALKLKLDSVDEQPSEIERQNWLIEHYLETGDILAPNSISLKLI